MAIFDEAVWDASPIIRIFCAELHGYCANLQNIKKHVYPEKIDEEISRKERRWILDELDKNGQTIRERKDANEFAATCLNAMRGSKIFHRISQNNINTCSFTNKYDLNNADGEYWVIAYADSSRDRNIVVVIDDGEVLNKVYAENKFQVYTSLHIIFKMTCKEQVLTKETGINLFCKFYNKYFGRVKEDAKAKLNIDTMLHEIINIEQRKVVKRPFYFDDSG